MKVGVPTRVSLRNILFATDFSPCSEAVLPYARNLARQYDATLYIIHVAAPELVGVDPVLVQQVKTQADRQMEFLEATEQLKGIKYKTLVAEGAIWEMLSAAIREHQIDLVVLGTHGRTGFTKFVMGSVAEEIFRLAPCPVMTLGPKVCSEVKHNPEFHRIVYATDFAADSSGALDHALSFAQEYQASLTLLHALSEKSLPPEDPERAFAGVKDRLNALLPSNADMWCKIEAIAEVGTPAEVILKVATERHADLIVLGAHRPALFSAHLMDTAYKVVCEAPCPVLAVNTNYHRPSSSA